MGRYGKPMYESSNDADFDVTMTRPDPLGPVTVTRRVRATSVAAARREALREADAIYKHEWTITGVHSYRGELGR